MSSIAIGFLKGAQLQELGQWLILLLALWLVELLFFAHTLWILHGPV
jgi:hypothetical protein